MYDFQDHMEQSREANEWRRSRGQSAGSAKWGMSTAADLNAAFDAAYPDEQSRSEYVDAETAKILNEWRAQEVAGGLASSGRVAEAQSPPARKRENTRQRKANTMKSFYAPMSDAEFNRSVRKLGLSMYAAAPLLGISLRHIYRFSGGQSPVPATVARLLRKYVETGVPEKE